MSRPSRGVRSKREALKRLSRLAKSKLGSHPGLLVLPQLALRVRGRSPIEYVKNYFRARVRAPFTSPLGGDFDFIAEQPTQVVARSRDRTKVLAAIQDELYHYHLYLSNFLTHPRYGPEKEVGFSRGDTLEPIGLKEILPGTFRFRVRGVVVGRRDLLAQIAGANIQGPAPPRMPPAPGGSTRIFISIPTRPDAAEVGDTEWYDFTPRKWAKKHPHIPLRPPAPILLRPRPERSIVTPRYDRLFSQRQIRIAVLYGYDSEGHNTTKDARDTWQILTAAPHREFRAAETGRFGYHGPGLGFSDPTGGHFRRLGLDGTSAFQRGPGKGSGTLTVRYRLGAPLGVGGPKAPAGSILVGKKPAAVGAVVPAGTTIERHIPAEIRLYNFDKSYHLSAPRLIKQFVAAFEDNDIILYDGHANYGGGFYIGPQPNDILWASDIGRYAAAFSRRYQIFAIGACHAAGYFADLFYNDLRPRKSPHNLDIVAAVNETAFEDAVHQSLALVRAILQVRVPADERPADYERILLAESHPASFQSYIGVFGLEARTVRAQVQPAKTRAEKKGGSGPRTRAHPS